jgi:F420-non-reducing hydrogenase small subunit
MADKKLQIAIYWGAGCGGCDVAVLDTNEFILDVAALADIRLWPIAVDGKYKDVENMADGELDLTIFNGAVRNSENEEIAKLLRKKSKVLMAFGACSYMGGIPGLANLFKKDEIFKTAYLDNPSIESGNRVVPQQVTKEDIGELDIPNFYKRVYKLDQVVDVDYYMPGCPPAPNQVKAVLLAVATGKLPLKGSVVGASDRAVCDDCKRKKTEKKITKFYRHWEIIQDFDKCLLEQGIVCFGVATRSGCGVRCPDTGLGCRGCYGPLPHVKDHGAKLLSALASVVDSKDPEEIDKIISDIPDFIALAYRFGLPASILQRSFRS